MRVTHGQEIGDYTLSIDYRLLYSLESIYTELLDTVSISMCAEINESNHSSRVNILICILICMMYDSIY
jgi:hypothetical protein